MEGENELQSQGDAIDHRDLIPTEDRAEPVPETRERAPAASREEKDSAKEPKPITPQEDKRNSIVAKLRAQRNQADKEPAIDIPADMERRVVGPHVATREDRNRPQAAEAVQEQLKPENVATPRRITLKVNGEEREYDEEQVINYARIAVASQDALNDAKRERDAAREERQRASDELAEIRRLRALHSPSDETKPAPTQAKAEDSKPATDEELDTLIEAIQTGEIEDAKKALLQYGDQIERRIQGKIGDIDQRITASIRQQQEDARVRQETDQVISAFLAENEDFSSHPKRGYALIEESVAVMRDNLKALGVTDETIANIAQAKQVAPQFAVGLATRMLRGKGYELPDHAAVMREAAKRVREGFGLPDPAVRKDPPPVVNPTPSIVAERVERKQAMPFQPRRANVTPGSETVTEKSQEQRRKDAVRQRRAFLRGR